MARHNDGFYDLNRKIKLATIFGVLQSTLTDFKYIRDEWQQNCEEERLLGVDITGQMDCPIFTDGGSFMAYDQLKQRVLITAKEYSTLLGINMPTATTCVKPSGNCRPWWSLTTTDAGLLTLQELFLDHKESEEWCDLTKPINVVQDSSNQRLTRTYNNGLAKLVKVNMIYGLSVVSTPEHRWFVKERYRKNGKIRREPIGEWVAAKDLQPTDILEVKIGTYQKTTHSSLASVDSLSFKMRGNTKSITQPIEMNEDIAWLLGYLWGDGTLSLGGFRIRFIDQREENLLKAQRILQEQFGLEATLAACGDGRQASTLETASVYLWHWLIRNGVFKYYADKIDIIPQVIRASSQSDILAFMAGLLDSDGWVGERSDKLASKFSFTTADVFFAKHLQDVAWSVGLPIGCSENDTRGKGAFTQRSMYLLGSTAQIKADAFAEFAKHSNKIKHAALAPTFVRWEWDNPQKLYIVGKIKSIEWLADEEPTYDIEVENNHWFYAGAVKSHNSSQFLSTSSGIHPRYAPYYIRRIRVAASNPVSQFLIASGVPHHPEVGDNPTNPVIWVFEFPVKSPDGAKTRHNMSALDMLNQWKLCKENYTEHNPSMTCYVRDEEWLEVGGWIYKHWDTVGGLSFLPYSGGVYQLAPYSECTQADYAERMARWPVIDWTQLANYETSDMTDVAKEWACVAGQCEL